ncbi:MAG: hypothetical protein AAGE03_16790 [Pseudomonadota bacterium]
MSEDRGSGPITLADLLSFVGKDGLSRTVGFDVKPEDLDTIKASTRLRRRWSEMLQESRGMPPSVSPGDGPVVRLALTGDLEAFAEQVDAHLQSDRIRREISGPRVAELRRRYGDEVYEAALAWTGPLPEARADGWAAIDKWIAVQASPLREYLMLRRPSPDPDRWVGPAPIMLLDHAARCVAEHGDQPGQNRSPIRQERAA